MGIVCVDEEYKTFSVPHHFGRGFMMFILLSAVQKYVVSCHADSIISSPFSLLKPSPKFHSYHFMNKLQVTTLIIHLAKYLNNFAL